jgi:hypothetical protein
MILSENSSTRILSRSAEFPTKTIQPCHHSAKHGRAAIRHVRQPGGPVVYLCRSCWRQVCASETRAVLVTAWNSLFNVCASIHSGWRRVVAIAAPIGEGRAMV